MCGKAGWCVALMCSLVCSLVEVLKQKLCELVRHWAPACDRTRLPLYRSTDKNLHVRQQY